MRGGVRLRVRVAEPGPDLALALSLAARVVGYGVVEVGACAVLEEHVDGDQRVRAPQVRRHARRRLAAVAVQLGQRGLERCARAAAAVRLGERGGREVLALGTAALGLGLGLGLG